MAGRLAGKTCLRDGGRPGHRPRHRARLCGRGRQVIATDRDAAKLAGLDARQASRPSALDVLDDAAVAAAVGRAGPLDILFNCAGFVHQNTILTATDAEWDFGFDAQRPLHVAA